MLSPQTTSTGKDIHIDLFLVFLFSIFVYPVELKSSLLTNIYVTILPTIYLVLHINEWEYFTKTQIAMLGLALLLMLLSIVYPTLHGTYDFSYVMVTSSFFRYVPAFLMLACVLKRRVEEDASPKLYVFYLALATVAYVAGTIIFVVFPTIKTLWFRFFGEAISYEQFAESYGYTFRIGWQGFSGFPFTIRCTLSCIYLLYLYYGDTTFPLKSRTFLTCFIVCLLGNMFYGRTGFILSIVLSAISILLWGRSRLHVGTILLPLVIIAMVWMIAGFAHDIPFLSSWYNWVWTPIMNFLKTGSFENVSINTTIQGVRMPSQQTLLFGDGYYIQDEHYYMLTDSGIMRNLYFWGILGTIIAIYACIAAIWQGSWKDKILFTIIVTSFAVFFFKGNIYHLYFNLFFSISCSETIMLKPKAEYKNNIRIIRN